MVSVDGANGETHDRVRRMKGLHERIIKHLRAARAGGDFPTIIHSTLNAMNYQGIADLLRIWRDNGLTDGVLFSTITPIKGAGDDCLRLSRDQRVWIVGELLRLKEIYGDFIGMTAAMLRRLHPDHTALLTPQICGTAQWVESYDASGERIKQCILSEKANCSQCGCVVTTMTDSTKPSTIGGILEAFSFSARLSTLR